MNAIINKLKTSDSPVTLPIRTIDGIKVYAYIRTRKEHGVIMWCFLEIQSVHSYWDEDEHDLSTFNLFSMTESDPVLETCIPKMVETISKLKFDKLIGRFLTTNDSSVVEMLSLFEKFENVTLCFDKCCVCLDYTMSKTMCKHCVCIQCWDNIERDVCPMCRKNMENGKIIKDDEDEDDE